MFNAQYSLIKIKLITLPRILVFGLLFAVAACDDPAPKEVAHSSSKPEQINAFTAGGRSWLEVHDGVSPAVWLASREAGRDLSADDPAVASLSQVIEDADLRYTEDARMIANRAVQVQSMLAERGVNETPRQVIAGLASVADIGERTGFGETSQHYVNARIASPDRATALAVLKRQPLPTSTGNDAR